MALSPEDVPLLFFRNWRTHMSETCYYILANNEETGPFTIEQLQEMVANKKIPPEILYATPGMADWKPLSTILPPSSEPCLNGPKGESAVAGFDLSALWEQTIKDTLQHLPEDSRQKLTPDIQTALEEKNFERCFDILLRKKRRRKK